MGALKHPSLAYKGSMVRMYRGLGGLRIPNMQQNTPGGKDIPASFDGEPTHVRVRWPHATRVTAVEISATQTFASASQPKCILTIYNSDDVIVGTPTEFTLSPSWKVGDGAIFDFSKNIAQGGSLGVQLTKVNQNATGKVSIRLTYFILLSAALKDEDWETTDDPELQAQLTEIKEASARSVGPT